VIYEWSNSDGLRNFGDALVETLIPASIRNALASDDAYMYCFIGSVICDEIIDYALSLNRTPIFISCGWNGRSLSADRIAKSRFVGCRGAITQEKLKTFGVNVDITGDPGYAVPFIVPASPESGLSILIPHIFEDIESLDIEVIQVDKVVLPTFESSDGLSELISTISGASFVLAGAMHAAIVAHAYGVPFALFQNTSDGYIDAPKKWSDWLSSFDGITPQFFGNLTEGRNWFFSHKDLLNRAVEIDSSRAFHSLFSNLATVMGERINDLIEVDKLIKVDRDALIVEEDALKLDRDELAHQLDALKLDRDELAQQLDALKFDRDELAQDRDALKLDRDELAQQLDALKLDRDELAQDRDALKLDRDELAQDRDALAAMNFLITNSKIWRYTDWYRLLRSNLRSH